MDADVPEHAAESVPFATNSACFLLAFYVDKADDFAVVGFGYEFDGGVFVGWFFGFYVVEVGGGEEGEDATVEPACFVDWGVGADFHWDICGRKSMFSGLWGIKVRICIPSVFTR